MNENDIVFKVITLGDTGVGKTSIIKTFLQDNYERERLSTIGIGYSFKEVILKDGTTIKIKLIDTAGQEKYRAIAKSYYKNAQAVLFIFSYDNKDSLEHIEEWSKRFKEVGGSSVDIPMYLIGNKYDVENKEIEDVSIENLKNKIGINNFVKTSAKDNMGIEDLFNELVEKMYMNKKKERGETQKSLVLINTKEKKKKRQKKNKECC